MGRIIGRTNTIQNRNITIMRHRRIMVHTVIMAVVMATMADTDMVRWLRSLNTGFYLTGADRSDSGPVTDDSGFSWSELEISRRYVYPLRTLHGCVFLWRVAVYHRGPG